MSLTPNRRTLLRLLLPAASAAATWPAQAAPATATPDVVRLGAAWRTAEGDRAVDHVGILQVDWSAGSIRITSDIRLDSRAHGLLPEAGGGFLAIATRPGRWLVRVDPQGQVVTRRRIDSESPLRTFGGHVLASPDGQWLYTSETDVQDGAGWISVRDARSLERVAAWPSHGLDPHQMQLSDDGRSLFVANGGIPRDTSGKKRDLDRMAPSLVRLDLQTGQRTGQWHLDDPRLSIRHLAWNRHADGTPLLGIALQAEHDDPGRRRDAPVLALWDERQGLRLATRAGGGAGYAGDISAGPGGGFIVSGQRTGEGLLWHPDAPDDWLTVARLTEPCALAAWPSPAGVLIGAARGIARWGTQAPAAMLPWPQAMNPDNHWVVLG
ncbi:MAG: uncharacterized protein PWQ61_1774 [Betaproteobacteria bacterium]|nr:uncharacterized protein [Betaproteobacteria bacterium]